ncbi:MAG: response regulator transcription factor [Nitrospirales bacterium]|nr:response regulator transcription factor [Nitrospira sp.]MDR4500771.1 response regulator transcription factor [Nitrospirales bacterium]
MTILVADDDPVTQALLVRSLTGFGQNVVQYDNGCEAMAFLENATQPTIGILDWVMPGLNGPEICRALKDVNRDARPLYLVLVTTKGNRDDIVQGLEAGADDYMTKPFDLQELRARVGVGLRVLSLQEKLDDRVHRLEEALSEVKQLQGLLPICSYCKKIRDDQNYWQQLEEYFSDRAEVQFSHGVCPHCFEKEIVPQLQAIKKTIPLSHPISS